MKFTEYRFFYNSYAIDRMFISSLIIFHILELHTIASIPMHTIAGRTRILLIIHASRLRV